MYHNHHILLQYFAKHPVVQFLRKQFEVDGIRNRMNLPADRREVTDLGASPHTGGHLGKYFAGFGDYLNKGEKSAGYAAAVAGDTRARDEIVSDVNALVAAAKYALANGHLFANTPTGMNPEDANAVNDQWFENWRKYAADNQTQIQQMQETVDQFLSAGLGSAAWAFPLLSPTSRLSMAERIEILKRSRDGSPISLHFTNVGPVPDLPGLVPPFVNTRLPGFIPPSLEGLNEPEGFKPSNPLLTYGLPGFPAPSSDWQSLTRVPPSVAMPTEPQVLQFNGESGWPLIYLSDGSQVLGPQPPADQGSALLMGAGVLGSGLMMVPGAQSLGARLLIGLTGAALTSPAFSATASRGNNVTDGSVFSSGASPYNPFAVELPVYPFRDGSNDAFEPSGSPKREDRIPGSVTERARPSPDRFGNGTDTLVGAAPAEPTNLDKVPDIDVSASVAPKNVRHLARVNESNAGTVFTSRSAPVPYLPPADFNERFGSWAMPTAPSGQPPSSKPIGVFADEQGYLIPPPIFGVDGSGNRRTDAEEWFSRGIRPLLPPQ